MALNSLVKYVHNYLNHTGASDTWLYAHKSNSNTMNQQIGITQSASPIFLRPFPGRGQSALHNFR